MTIRELRDSAIMNDWRIDITDTPGRGTVFHGTLGNIVNAVGEPLELPDYVLNLNIVKLLSNSKQYVSIQIAKKEYKEFLEKIRTWGI